MHLLRGQLHCPLAAEPATPAVWGPPDAADTSPQPILCLPLLLGTEIAQGFLLSVLTLIFPLKSCTHGHSLGSVFCPLYSRPLLLGDHVHCQDCDWWEVGHHLWSKANLNPRAPPSLPAATGRGPDLGPNEAGASVVPARAARVDPAMRGWGSWDPPTACCPPSPRQLRCDALLVTLFILLRYVQGTWGLLVITHGPDPTPQTRLPPPSWHGRVTAWLQSPQGSNGWSPRARFLPTLNDSHLHVPPVLPLGLGHCPTTPFSLWGLACAGPSLGQSFPSSAVTTLTPFKVQAKRQPHLPPISPPSAEPSLTVPGLWLLHPFSGP